MATIVINLYIRDSKQIICSEYNAKSKDVDEISNAEFVIDNFGVLKTFPAKIEDAWIHLVPCVRGSLYKNEEPLKNISFIGTLSVSEAGKDKLYKIIPCVDDATDIDRLVQEHLKRMTDEAIANLQKAMDTRRDYEIQKALDEQKRPYSLNEYMRDAMRTKGDFNLRDQLSDGGLGISGEAGEVSDPIKKHLFHGHPLEIIKLLKELGDVLWYIAEIADAAGFTLEDVARWNIKKLEERYPDGFSEEASINRKE